MPRLQTSAPSRISRDPAARAIRSWFDTAAPLPLTEGKELSIAVRELLRENADQFGWDPALPDLKDGAVIKGAGTYSVRATQTHRGIPVDASEIVVDLFSDRTVYSVYNNYRYDIPKALDPAAAKFTATQARALVGRLVKPYKENRIGEPTLIVYRYHPAENHPPHPARSPNPRQTLLRAALAHQLEHAPEEPKEGEYFLAWDIRVTTKHPSSAWRFLIDAMTGRLIKVLDLLQYASGNSSVFDPNPIVTSGDTALRHNSPAGSINAQRFAVTVDRLDPPDGSGNLHLDGSFVHMGEIESPTVSEPVSPTGNFAFNFDDNGFLNAMAYFHIDRFQHYVQSTLNLTNVANFSIAVDPQGLSGADNSHYNSSNVSIDFGGGIVPVPAGNPVPDAADAMVVLHEYGHAIQDNVNPGFDNPVDGTGEGFGDFLAAVFYDDKHANPAATRGFMMSWDSEMASGSWAGRRYDVGWLFDGPEFTGSFDNHVRGQLWCATMFELYRKLGGDSQYAWVKSAAKDLAIRLHLAANFNVPASGSTAAQMGQQVEAADSNLGGWRYPDGLHKKVIYDTFRRRHLSGYPALPVDVYINDGRNGGYGSLTGNDAFSEKLWLDVFWETQDLWVRVVPYADNAAQQAGDPGDHVEPPVNQTAYFYVRVKNKGTSDSGPVTVKAFHCDPGMGLEWPTGWLPMDTPSLTVSNIPAGGKVVVGPFPWTPTEVGHECTLAIVECASDHAVTQDLAPGAHVAHSDLVPMDNNIAQRNLVPTAAKGKTVRGFYVHNPHRERSVFELHFENTLPPGWHFHTSVPDPRQIVLGPGERRWIDLTIDQAGGKEVTTFDRPMRVAVTCTSGGRLIGGMTFYLAPPSAFPGASTQRLPGACAHDLLGINIPWHECAIEGEIDVKLRFRRPC